MKIILHTLAKRMWLFFLSKAKQTWVHLLVFHKLKDKMKYSETLENVQKNMYDFFLPKLSS